MNQLKNIIFRDDAKAREWLERMLWPQGPICPFCGSVDSATALETRPGLYQCNESECRKQFTVTVGTLFERSHIPLSKWLMAAFLLCASKKGMSAHQMHRMIGVSYKSTWFMMHRLREAMKEGNPEPMGGSGPIQADETYFGPVANPRMTTVSGRPFTKSGKTGPSNKRPVIALVSGGKARTFHVACADAKTVREILDTNATREAELHTDESRLYLTIGKEFAAHRKVNHKAGEYVGKAGETINACENYFSIFKRGMRGVYQHCSEKHLHRYLAEFDFRYNARGKNGLDDANRTAKALKGIVGKRLTYRRINQSRLPQANS